MLILPKIDFKNGKIFPKIPKIKSVTAKNGKKILKNNLHKYFKNGKI